MTRTWANLGPREDITKTTIEPFEATSIRDMLRNVCFTGFDAPEGAVLLRNPTANNDYDNIDNHTHDNDSNDNDNNDNNVRSGPAPRKRIAEVGAGCDCRTWSISSY